MGTSRSGWAGVDRQRYLRAGKHPGALPPARKPVWARFRVLLRAGDPAGGAFQSSEYPKNVGKLKAAFE
jgi:hypothetical protein